MSNRNKSAVFNIINHKAFFTNKFFSTLFFIMGFSLIPFLIDRTGNWGLIGRFNLPSWYYVVVIVLILMSWLVALIFIGISYKQGSVIQNGNTLVFKLNNRRSIHINDNNRIKVAKLPFFSNLLYSNKMVCLEIKNESADWMRVVVNCRSEGQKAYFIKYMLKSSATPPKNPNNPVT